MGGKGERRRQELLKIAYELFTQRGYEETSVDDIIAQANIAKGTYYYHFPSKEATLEEVINMMINDEVRRARAVVSSPLPVPQKLVGVIVSFRPEQSESTIANALNRQENLVMHDKVERRIIEEAVPLLSEVVSEGIGQGLFDCNYIEERVRMILVMGQRLFDSGEFTAADIEVYTGMVENTLGAKPGTMGFISGLIGKKD